MSDSCVRRLFDQCLTFATSARRRVSWEKRAANRTKSAPLCAPVAQFRAATFRVRLATTLPPQPYALDTFPDATFAGYAPSVFVLTNSGAGADGWAFVIGLAEFTFNGPADSIDIAAVALTAITAHGETLVTVRPLVGSKFATLQRGRTPLQLTFTDSLPPQGSA